MFLIKLHQKWIFIKTDYSIEFLLHFLWLIIELLFSNHRKIVESFIYIIAITQSDLYYNETITPQIIVTHLTAL